MNDWLTIPEAAQVAKIGPKVLYRAIRTGQLRAARLGGPNGRIRIHREWVDAWLEASAKPIEIRAIARRA